MALKPTLTIPTVYETRQRELASRRKLAETMLAQGMGMNPNMTHWTQVLGQLAQAWAGKSMTRDVDKLESTLNTDIQGDYAQRREGFLQDASGQEPSDLVAKYGADPMLADELKPYRDAMASRLKSDQNLIKDGSFFRREGEIQSGSLQSPDYNQSVIPDGQGNMIANPVKITASLLSQGYGTGANGISNPVTSMPVQGQKPGGSPPPPSAAQASAQTFSSEQFRGALQSLGPAAAGQFLLRNKFRVRIQDESDYNNLPAGAEFYAPDGSFGIKR